MLNSKSIFKFWLPLVATWTLMNCESAVVAAFIARMPQEKLNLASFGVVFSILLFCESPILGMVSASIAFVKDRPSYRSLLGFSSLLSAAMSLVMVLLSTKPLSSFLVLDLLHLAPEMRALVSKALLTLSPCPFFVSYRRFYQGVLISHGLTRLVALGTITRLSSVVGVAAMMSHTNIPGVQVGALALVSGMVCEGIVSRLLASGAIAKLLNTEGETVRISSLLQFYLPLSLTIVINLAILPLNTLFLSHSAYALESLAVVPVINAFLLIIRSISLSYQEVVIAMYGVEDTSAPLVDFAKLLGVLSLVLTGIVAFTPLRTFWLSTASALSAELTQFAILPLMLGSLIPAISVGLSFQRGVFIKRKRTGFLTKGAALEVLTIVSIQSIGMFSSFTGAAVVMVAVSAGQVVDTLYLNSKKKGWEC